MIMKEIQKRMMQNIDKEVKPLESNYAGLYAIIFMRSSQIVLAFERLLIYACAFYKVIFLS